MYKLIQLLVIIILLLVVVGKGWTQVDQELFHAGLKAGINSSNVYGGIGQDFSSDAKYGWVAGGFVSIPLWEHFGLQPEILLSQKGFEATGSLLDAPYQLNRTTTYLDIPVFIALKTNSYLTILAGPQFSYLLSQKDELAASPFSVQQQQIVATDQIRENIIGVVIGLDVQVKRVVFSVRSGWDALQNNKDVTSLTPRYKNIWLQATVGFRII
ncbi:MAG: porin family protein [Cyclobacteriaceae bacterium]|jgi:hypothetical protein|nr:PorT family protein [Flammeovirgaceae bacterium]